MSRQPGEIAETEPCRRHDPRRPARRRHRLAVLSPRLCVLIEWGHGAKYPSCAASNAAWFARNDAADAATSSMSRPRCRSRHDASDIVSLSKTGASVTPSCSAASTAARLSTPGFVPAVIRSLLSRSSKSAVGLCADERRRPRMIRSFGGLHPSARRAPRGTIECLIFLPRHPRRVERDL